MRLYIRNKVKYDPSNVSKPLVFVEIPDPRGFSVGQVKEEFKKKVRAAKVDSLYHRQGDGSYEVLADDRTVGFYNIQDNAILETTSNPLWAAAIYYRLREVERDAANQPDDGRASRGLEQSSIQKFMALGILFNGGNNPERQQPPYFEELDQLFEHLQTAGKKPVHMSQKTLDTLQTLKDEYEQNDIHERDSIGHFVDRQAVKLGLTSKSKRNGDNQGHKGAGWSTELQSAQVAVGGSGIANSSTDNNKGKRSAGPGRGGRRAPQKQRTCEDCEENVATQFCADCQPPLVLCDDCAVALHRGATRRNHQIKDVAEAPAPAKGYTPKAYRAPFAMLVAFHRAANEVPSKMSLTADELKPRAQPLTNTDLEVKQGRWFGGFDSLENALMKNELVQKEARTPKYSLMEKGQPLAARCSEFDYAVQNLMQAASVPTIPVTGARPVLRNRQLCLLVDSEEPLRERFVRVARQRGLSAKTRKLPVGDFLWVLLPPGVNPDTVRDMPDQELVLSMIVERKTWDDLWSSLKTTRFNNQVQRMKRCGLKNLFYLVEGSPKELKGNPGPEVETYLQDKIDSLLLEDQFLVNRTGSWLKTVEWLCHLTNMSIESLQSEANLTTYSEFSHSAKLRRKLDGISYADAASATVWSAAEFTNAIRSHSCGGKELHDLPVSGEGGRSLIVIQGLTLYNKQFHKLLDKALSDLLENRHQTADACVQRHLQGVTDQLIHQDVTQWYIMWLQVFKGAMVRRTETEEESAEILCKFYQKMSAVPDAHYYYGDVGYLGGEAEESLERLPDEDVIFANDSQEEDAMIRQALRASEYEKTTPSRRDVSRSSLVKPPSSTTTKAQAPISSGSGAQTYSLNEKEQLELALKLSAAENAPTGSCKSPVKTPVTPSRKRVASSHTPVIPRTNTQVLKSSHTAVCNDKTRSVSPDDELEAVLKLSLEESKCARERQEHKIDLSDGDNDLEKALELSRMEYEQSKERMGYKVEHQDDKGRDCEPEKALELSKLESETKNREQQHHEDISLDVKGEEAEQTRAGIRTLTGQEQNGKDVIFSADSDLQKALELSKIEYQQHSALNHRDPSECLTSSKDNDFAQALELSRMDCKQVKENAIGMPREKRLKDCIVSQPSDSNKDQGRDSDLERVLELSRIEYTQPNSGVLDGNDERSDSDIIVLDESQSVSPSRQEEINDSYIPSSIPSDHEWDLENESREHEVRFDALNPVTVSGNSKDCAILLDSQELDNDTEDDFTYALKIQEELNKEINARSNNHHESPSKRETTCPELKDQLTEYRQSQKEKYDTFSGQRGKSSRGLDFRRNVVAIASGKPVQIGVASPISRPGNSLKGRESARVIGENSSCTSRIDRNNNGLHGTTKRHSPCRDEVHVITDDVPVGKTTGSPSMGSVKHGSDRFSISQRGAISSPRPFSSTASTFERVHKRNSSTLPGSCLPFSSAGSSSIPSSFSSGSSPASHSNSSSDKPVGPKCGACGEIGHNKNSKMCPHYFSVEAVQRREEQSRKRKAKREEEEREFNNYVGTLAAERISMEDQTRILAEQLEQLRRRSQSMADTQKKVEDAIKRKRRKR